MYSFQPDGSKVTYTAPLTHWISKEESFFMNLLRLNVETGRGLKKKTRRAVQQSGDRRREEQTSLNYS